MPIDITNKEEKQIALTGTQIEETLLQAHLSKDAIANIEGMSASGSEIDSLVNQTFSNVKETRIRENAGITLAGSYLSSTNGNVIIYKVTNNESFVIRGQSLGTRRLLYAFYPTDTYAKPIELGLALNSEITTYNENITVPIGANYLYLYKADGYEIGLYTELNLNEKADKASVAKSVEALTNLANKASNGSKYVDNGLNPITFSDGKELYLWQIIKSFILTYPNTFNPYTNEGLLRTIRINSISKTTAAYISFVITSQAGLEVGFSGTNYRLPFGEDEKNISGTLKFAIDGVTITADVVYDFSEISSNSNSTDSNTSTSGNNILSSRIIEDNFPKTKVASELDYSKINAFNLLEKAPGMIKFGSSAVIRTRHASCVFGDMHEDWTPLYNISKIYDFCPDFKDYVFATIGVGDFLIFTRTREANLVVLKGLKTAISSHNIPFGACIGGHDFGNDTSDATNRNRVTHCLTKQDQRDNIIVPSFNTFESASLGTGKTDACYWYADDTDRSVRYIFLDECDLPDTLDTDTDFYKYDRYADLVYSQEQLTWLTETALNVSSGWNIVLCTHTATSYKDGVHDIGGTVGAMWDCVTAYNDKLTASINLTGEIPITINKDFSSSNGKIICMLWGHTHAAANHIKDGINIVNVPNSGFYGSNAGYSLKNAQDRDCAEFLIADTVDNDLRFLRYGRRGVNVISNGIPLEIKPGDSGDRFVDTPLTF